MIADHRLVVAGATGDLCGRLLLPALARLYAAGELPTGFRFLGAGPQPWEPATFQEHVRARLATFAPDLAPATREAFIGGLSYRRVDVLDAPAFGALLDSAADGGPLTLYLALPTDLIASAVQGVAGAGLSATVRVAVEKPFGSDLASAQDLNAALARATSEEHQVYRVDHILGMPTVQALPDMMVQLRRTAGPSPRPDIAAVSILWEETLALEGRAAFYDRAGALKDLLQNHLLQILCLMTMDTPAATTGGNWSDRRLKAMQAVRIPTADEARTNTRRARYTAGTLAGTGERPAVPVPDYTAEPGVDPGRATETFAQVALALDAPEWRGTQFVLRAGKAMARHRRGVLVRYREQSVADRWIDLDPPTVHPPAGSAHPAFGSAPLEQLAYVNVLRDLLSGSDALSVSREEAELAWRIFAPTLEQWAAGTVPLEQYPAGTTP